MPDIEHMMTIEQKGDDFVATILDESGAGNDLEVHFSSEGTHIFLRQPHEDCDQDVVALTPTQATCLATLIGSICEAVEEGPLH